MNRAHFDPSKASLAHEGTILASAVLPKGVMAPFQHAWGYLEGPGEMQVHSHPPQEVYFFFQGHGYVMVDGEKEPVSAGDVIDIPPNALHTVSNETDEPLLWAALWWNRANK